MPDVRNAKTLSTIAHVSALRGELLAAAATLTCEVEASGCERVPDTGPLESGCVCCIFTVAFGNAGALLFGASLGRLIRAVSFFGETGLAMPDGAAGGGTTPLGALGRSGTVGRPLSGGGFGGGVALLSGFVAVPAGGGGTLLSGFVGGPPTGGLGGKDAGGGVTALCGREIFEVSFLGIELSGWLCVPGTLIRTVSRFTPGASPFGGSVMRMVSFFVESSSCGGFVAGFSSAIIVGSCE